METTEADKYLVGRVDPQIYAFITNEIPNSLKVGDTYRSIDVRLSEWRHHYKHLDYVFSGLAVVNKNDKDVNDVFFRDYSVHQFLIYNKHRSRLIPEDLTPGVYYSQEFFKAANKEDVIEAIIDIKRSYKTNEGIYQFYKIEGKDISKNDTEIERDKEYKLRNVQEDTINKFISAISKGRTKMLMYAVMRFGKSFTAMYCAKEIGAKLVVVVSGKIDVEEEWRKTVLGLKNFDGYNFLGSKDLGNYDAISKKLNESNVVVFVSLQDLQGPNIKPRHRELFDSHIDLLIVDETHFGARAEEYGKILKNSGLEDKQIKEELKQQGFDAKKEENAQTHIKALNTKYRIDLSGTPYRILMNSEYSKDDIIAFYQYSDIVDEQKKWDEKFLTKEVYDNDDEKDGYKAGDAVQEWDNPYYGFPQMIRFAFNPNESSVNMMKELEDKGLSSSLSELMRPISIEKDENNKYKEFVHKKEVLDLFQVIDGSKDDKNVLGFLDYDKIKNGKMCRHIVCVLPFCASCDALKEFLISNKDKFKNLNDYEIINIAGFDERNAYPTVRNVTSKIEACEKRDKKTISLTVGRMLTGTTVKEWDTMIFLKDTSSPQEYDQAIFRIQNQYVTTKKSADGSIIKYNMKPQTLLVDFSPNRMFYLQGEKSLIYNLNVAKSGNSDLQERLRKELAISPIIFVNRNRLQQAVPKDIIKAVCEYSANIDIVDDIKSIGIDASLLDIPSIKEVIESQSELGSRGGFSTKAVEGKGDDLKKPDTPKPPTNPDTDIFEGKTHNKKDENDSIRKKFETYYSRILFYAFLTKSRVISLQEIIASINGNNANERIIEHLELDKDVLQLIAVNINYSVKQSLDEAIFKTNTFANDESVDVLKRSLKVMNKFPRLSETEIATPAKIAEDMVAMIPESAINSNTKILDIASKEGEFAMALYSKYGETVKKNIYSIPTSNIAYEFTRKIYENFELPLENILPIYSPDLINDDKNETIINMLQDMKFDVIIGNPPYQQGDGGAGVSAKPIYNEFVDIAKLLKPSYFSAIIPAKWYNGGKGLERFRNMMLNDKSIMQLVDFTDEHDCFPVVDVAGGICYFLWGKEYNGLCEYRTQHKGLRSYPVKRNLGEFEQFLRFTESVGIINKIKNNTNSYLNSLVRPRKPFGLSTNVQPLKTGDVILRFNGGLGYYNKKEILQGKELIDKWKIITSRLTAEHAGQFDKDGKKRLISTLEILEPNAICSETYLLLNAFETKKEALNFYNYIKTKFVRFLISMVTGTQQLARANFSLVPVLDYNESWIDEKLYKKYNLSDDEINFIESMIKPME